LNYLPSFQDVLQK